MRERELNVFEVWPILSAVGTIDAKHCCAGERVGKLKIYGDTSRRNE